MPIFDYKCECGKTKKDHRVNKWDEVVKCECKKVMSKCISAPNIGGMDKFGRSN